MLLTMKDRRLKYIITICTLLILAGLVLAGSNFYRAISRDPMSAFETPSPVPAASSQPALRPSPSPTPSPEEQLMAQADRDFMRNRVNILLLGWDQSHQGPSGG